MINFIIIALAILWNMELREKRFQTKKTVSTQGNHSGGLKYIQEHRDGGKNDSQLSRSIFQYDRHFLLGTLY